MTAFFMNEAVALGLVLTQGLPREAMRDKLRGEHTPLVASAGQLRKKRRNSSFPCKASIEKD